ncbi:DNA-directed RNA polymerase V subunit 1 [Vitis vinifera]|uniref:DNA-directed RNA polymerase V subunit 1 n=1 Tax=Vitis vinifera TaxID=29760 RepID=A0A438GAX7_VITVI|nr:DNA-directed RNA polymerase V subunit 1 [Vitis vinifera]
MFKEFHEQSSFLKSLNNTFLVLIPKKGGAVDLGDFRPISLLGGLYKLMAKVLANRLKRVLNKVVAPTQNAFVMGRQILDASLIANEFSVLVNGVPAGFFPSSKGLRQGDPLSPYLFVLGMEVLDALIRRAVAGGYLLGCSFQGDRRHNLKISHLFFVDDTIVFCEANKEHLTHLSWILLWFEAASGLRINLDKSEIIPVGVVEEMTVELGCRVGSLPSQYLGLPLGAPNKTPSVWDGVEEKMRRRLARWKRQYILKGGRITLIRSSLASMPIYHMSLFRMPKSMARRLDKQGGLGLRKLVLLNKALLGKWIWRFAYDKDNLWKQVITTKYGQEGHGWRAKRAYGAFGVGVWMEIWKETDWCWDNMGFIVGKGSKINFWTDVWCNGTRLSQNFPHLFAMASHRNATVEEMWDQNFGQGGCNIRFLRDFNDWEMDMIGNLLHVLRDYKPSMEEDSVCWKGGRNGKFRVKEAYRLVARPNDIVFPSRCIWVNSVPTKVAFYAWEVTWGRVLTLDRLQKRGWQLPNCCFLCGCEEETVNHILIHCIVVRVLWDIVLGLSGVQWVFPETVKEVSRHSSFLESRCFYVVSTDGHKEDFSYRKCLENFIKEKYPDNAETFIGKYFRRPRAGGNRERSVIPEDGGNREQSVVPEETGREEEFYQASLDRGRLLVVYWALHKPVIVLKCKYFKAVSFWKADITAGNWNPGRRRGWRGVVVGRFEDEGKGEEVKGKGRKEKMEKKRVRAWKSGWERGHDAITSHTIEFRLHDVMMRRMTLLPCMFKLLLTF